MKQQLDIKMNSLQIGDKVYLSDVFYDLGKVRVLRQGILAGEIIKDRFEPHQHFYVSAKFRPYLSKITSLSHDEMLRFMQGEVLHHPVGKGHVGLVWNDHVIGFGKSDGQMIKNKLPKGLRQR